MTTITKEHKEKIDKAIDLCEKSLDAFMEHFARCSSKEEAEDFKAFLLRETYFAGGLFRSIFTESNINDIDIYFRSKNSILEFKHRLLKMETPVFTESSITKRGTYVYHGFAFEGVGLPITFITYQAGDPSFLIREFDYTFNQHFFSLNDFKLYFDISTFDKMGHAVAHVKLLPNPEQEYANVILRGFRFNNEGFKIDINSLKGVLRNLNPKASNLGNFESSSGRFTRKPFMIKGGYSEHHYFNYGREKQEYAFTGADFVTPTSSGTVGSARSYNGTEFIISTNN